MAIGDLHVNRVTDLLYDIATKIGEYYGACRVIGGPEEASRVLLLDSVRKVMAICFDLLGMKTIDKI